MGFEGVVAAARAVRWYLPELVGPVAGQIDETLAELLAEEWDEDVGVRLRQVMERAEGTSAFLEAVLDDTPDFRPPQVRSRTLKSDAYDGLPGLVGQVEAPMFHCPAGDYDWWRPAVGTPIPKCPTHECMLVRA
ncbi:hypothetical protein [Phytoactinopolyspora limicola]|uniref:hypothetical protein n=1 Tax=Phytoactinopolyspora limicola TaxID=2715536 RepID=UPI00140D1E13|nr:hypothetical protein [Phytoactinopolyspora limicola]